MPKDFKIEESDSFGYSLIQAFMSKLDATMEIVSESGTSIEFEINEFGLA